jgi:catechol 2,3-dioxygenase-like lactoylglutathione lyase family enzyme
MREDIFDNPGTKVLRPAYLAHVVLRTPDVDSFNAMTDFYVKFLDAEITYQNKVLSFLTYDEEHHRIAIGIFPETTKRVGKPAGLAHIAFTYNTLHDLALSYRQRKALGIEPFWCVNHGPTTSLYFHDPDGNEIETQVDNFDGPQEATRFFASREFEDNPIGVDFDPEDLIRRLRNGESEETMKKRPNIGVRQGIPGW